MGRFCGECGAPLAEDARFCGECGAAVERPPEPGPAPSVRGPEEAPAAQPARERKPLPKWVLPVGIAAVSAAVILTALSLVLKSLGSPERTADKFLAAMEAGDYAALAKVSAPDEESAEFSEEAAAPMFRLYQESARFRKGVEDALEEDLERIEDGDEPNEGMVVNLRPEKRFLHTAYTVVIGTCDVDLSSNLACTVQIGGRSVMLEADSDAVDGWADVYGADCALAVWSSGNAYDMLPGAYTLSSTVTTSFGDVFEAETELEIFDAGSAYGELYFEYQTLDVYNDGSMDAELYLGGGLYGTVPAGSDFLIAPIHAETQVEARADAGTGEPMTETFDAGEGYFYLSFVLCEVEIHNGYAAPMTVRCGGELLETVEPGESAELSGLPSGTELTMQLYEEVTEPVAYICEYESDYLYPEFSLTEKNADAVDEAVRAYITGGLDAYNRQDTAALAAMDQTEFSAMLAAEVEENLGYTLEEDGFTYVSQITMGELECSELEIGAEEAEAPAAVAYYEIPYENHETVTTQDGTVEENTTEGGLYYAFTVRYTDGAWSIAGAV